MKNELAKISTVTEYQNAGGLKIGFLLEGPEKETEKAIAFPGVKFNSYGNPYNSLIWFPKSQLRPVLNDFYTDRLGETMYLCPAWLYRKNPTVGEVAA